MKNLENEIFKDLYQFTMYIPPMDFTIHQYLLATDPAILFATGTAQQAQQSLPEIQKILGDRSLKYIFVAHMESDEMGGVGVFQRAYPNVTVLCGHLAAREFSGLEYNINVLPKKGGEILEDGDLKLQFVDYPSEVHLQDGLVALEMNSGIFYSADLMMSFGNGIGKAKEGNWKNEVEAIPFEYIPNEQKLNELKNSLKKINPKFIAVGHGYCVECR